jgi:ferritin-like metal-binding protein YciE
MSEPKNLGDAYYELLRDVFYAEKQALRACKKSARAATHPALKQAFEHHAEETEGQIERLQKIFEQLGKQARGKTCEAMQGILAELEEDAGDFAGSPAADAVIIGAGQALEHYEIARYGTLKTWAQQLGHQEAARLLDETLAEEKKADELLTKLSREVNQTAAA